MSNELVSNNIVDDILQCAVCYERLRDPKRLPCGHIFCERCVRQLRTKYCPQCRTAFNSNADDLPLDLTIVKLLEASKPSRRCHNCPSKFARECFHCRIQYCESCILEHLRASLREKTTDFDDNVPDDVENWNDLCERIRNRIDESIESARRKALVHMETHYSLVKQIWGKRLEQLLDDHDEGTGMSTSIQLRRMREIREKSKTGHDDCQDLSDFRSLYAAADDVLDVIHRLQVDMDKTFDELVAVQWNMNETTTNSQIRLRKRLDTDGLVTRMFHYSDHEAMLSDESMSDAGETFPNASESEDGAIDSGGEDAPITNDVGYSFNPKPSLVSGGYQFGSSSTILGRRAKATPVLKSENTSSVPRSPNHNVSPTLPKSKKHIIGPESETRSFEENRFKHWLRQEPNGQTENDAIPPSIRLYTHTKTGLLNTPMLDFWMEPWLREGEPIPSTFPPDRSHCESDIERIRPEKVGDEKRTTKTPLNFRDFHRDQS